MAFEVITPGGNASTAASPSGAPSGSSGPAGSSGESAAANSGTVSLDDALKGADHTKTTTFSVSDLSKGSGTAGAGSGSGSGTGQSVPLGGLVQAKIAIDLADSLIPAALVLIAHRIGLEIRKTQFSLTQGEKNTLLPIVEQCLNQINLNFSSPWQSLAVSLLVIYGGKFAEVAGTGWMDKKSEEKRRMPPVVSVAAASNPGAERQAPGGQVQPPAPNPPGASADVIAFDPSGPRTWTDNDVTVLMRKKKISRDKAVAWLERNWAKKGGVI